MAKERIRKPKALKKPVDPAISERKRKEGSKTQFGKPGGNKPARELPDAPKPHSIRRMYGVLCNQDIDLKDPQGIQKVLDQITGGRPPKIAQALAAAAVRKGLMGNLNAIEMITVNAEGKLPDTVNINPRSTLPKPTNLEEAQRYFLQVSSELIT